MEADNEPVLVITDADGYLIQAGQPSSVKAKDMTKYLKEGYSINTMTIKQFREDHIFTQWVWEKPKTIK